MVCQWGGYLPHYQLHHLRGRWVGNFGQDASLEIVARLDIVAAGEFFQRRALRPPPDSLFFCAGVREGGRPKCFPWALARLLPSAVRVRIRSRSTSASPPRTTSIKRPVLLVLSAHGSAKDRNCVLRLWSVAGCIRSGPFDRQRGCHLHRTRQAFCSGGA